MIFGMTVLTFVHVLLSLTGILAGLVVASEMLAGKPLGGWNTLFFWTTVLTSVTGFLFPFHKFLPGHAVGILSLAVLAVAGLALYKFHLAARSRRIYVATAMTALYLNCFVLVVQAFLKVGALKALAPTGSEPPFLAAQLVVLALFVVMTVVAVKKARA